MKLLYKLSEKEQAVYDKHSTDGEKIMYCLPYNLEDGHFISGHVVITDRFIYRIFEDTLAAKYDFSELSDFSVETLVGSSAFYAKVKGTSTVVCRFLSGRYLSHYTLMVRACKTIAEAVAEGKDPGDPLENDTPELFCDKCGTPLIRGTNICPKCREKGSAFKKLWALTKGMRALLFIPVIVSGISLILQFVVPRIQSSAIDNYLDNELATMANAPAFLMVFALLLGIDILQRAMSIAQSRAANVSGTKFVRILRLVVFEKIQSLSLSSIQRHSTGDLMARLNSDVSVTQSFITGTLPNILNQVLSFVIALVILLFVKPILCLFVFIPIIPVCFIAKKVWDKFGENSRRLWKDSFEVNCVTQDTIQGERIVKSFGRENSAVEKQHKAINKRTAQAIRSQNYTATMAPIISFLFKLGSYIILFYGNILVFGGDLTLGQLFEYTAYTSILYAPLTTLLALPSTLSTVVNSINKVMEILDEEPEIVDIDLPIDIKIEGDIKIDNISFGYNSYDPVLKNISVDIKQGEMIGIVGASGSGKSTLINLIMRMYDVNEGAITIDNVNIKDISQQALRSQMGIVLQETHLFRGSIRDNIAYAKPYATNEEIIRAAKLANAHEFICNLPQGYNTMIGERGFSLSGGERQRVAIARALIHDPRIIILDEATAALDTETEKMIQDSINILMKGRTTLAIAHRLSTLRNADKLIVLDNGRLAEFGTHSELLKLKGIYYKLVMAQRLNAVK